MVNIILGSLNRAFFFGEFFFNFVICCGVGGRELGKVNKCLGKISYQMRPDSNFEGITTITLQANDLGHNTLPKVGIQHSDLKTIDVNISIHCGGIIELKDSGVLRDRLITNTSPPSSYLPNQVCLWAIYNVNTVTSTKFDVRSNGGDVIESFLYNIDNICSDGLYISDSVPPTLNNNVNRWCGKDNETVRYKSPYTKSSKSINPPVLYILFISDGTDEGSGFELVITSNYRDTSDEYFRISYKWNQQSMIFTEDYVKLMMKSILSISSYVSLTISLPKNYTLIQNNIPVAVMNVTITLISERDDGGIPLIIRANLFNNAFKNFGSISSSLFKDFLNNFNVVVIFRTFSFGNLKFCKSGWRGATADYLSICSCFPGYYGTECELRRDRACVTQKVSINPAHCRSNGIINSCCSSVQENILITSSIDNYISILNTDSKDFVPFSSNVCSSSSGGVSRCASLAVHPNNDKVLIISNTFQIISLSSYTGKFINVFADEVTLHKSGFVGSFQPLAIKFGPDNYLYSVDTSGSIHVLDQNGNYVATPYQDLSFMQKVSTTTDSLKVKQIFFSPKATYFNATQFPEVMSEDCGEHIHSLLYSLPRHISSRLNNDTLIGVQCESQRRMRWVE